MKTFGIQLQEGSSISNLSVSTGTAFPASPNDGELFYRSDADTSVLGLYCYVNGSWDRISSTDSMTVPNGSSLPGSTSNAGDLFYLNSNDANEGLYAYSGSAWAQVGGGAPTYTITGDVTGTIDGGTDVLTLGTVNANVGTFGSGATVSTVTVNAKGLTTAVSETPIAIAASQVTSGAFADARISPSSVTQHQAALTILETQITDGALLARVAANETISGSWTLNSGAANTALAITNSTAGGTTYFGVVDSAAYLKIGATSATSFTININGTDFMSMLKDGTNLGIGLFNGAPTGGISLGKRLLMNGTEAISLTRDFSGQTMTLTGNAIAATPTLASHLTTKGYVDAAIAGLTWKAPVKVATTANITRSGTQTIDGVALSVNDRVLVKDQLNLAENGVYVVSGAAWSRATDFDDISVNSAAVFVSRGTTQSDTAWTQTAAVTTVGTDPMTFVQFSAPGAYTAGNGLTLVGNDFRVGTASTSRIVVNADNIDLASRTDNGTGTFLKVNVDIYGRVMGTVAVSASDVTSLVDSTYVNVTGDTMTGDLFLNNNIYLTSYTTALDKVRMAGINASNVAYIGPIDAGPTSTVVNASSTSTRTVFYNLGNEAMRLDSTGLGVGTTTPSSKIEATNNDNSITSIKVTNTDTGANADARFVANNGNTNAGLILRSISNLFGGNVAVVYVNGNNPLTFLTNATERMRIDGSGYTSIGPGSAVAPRIIEVAGAGTAGTVNALNVEGVAGGIYGGITAVMNHNTASADGSEITLARTRGVAAGAVTAVSNGDVLGGIAFAGADGTDIRTKAAEIFSVVDGTVGSSVMPGCLVFSTTTAGEGSPTERLRITSTGYIGVATATPQVALQIGGDANYRELRLSRATDSTPAQALVFRKTRGTESAPTVTVAGDTLGSVLFNTSSAAGNTGVAAQVVAQTDVTPGANDSPGRLVFYTTPAGSLSSTERMRIDSNGNVGINNNNPTYKLAVNGHAYATSLTTLGWMMHFNSYAVATATSAAIALDSTGSTTLDPSYMYRVSITTIATSAATGAVWIAYPSAASTWTLVNVSNAGFASNNPTLTLSGSSLRLSHNHASTNNFTVHVERKFHGNTTLISPTFLGLEAVITNVSGNIGVGVSTAPVTKLDVGTYYASSSAANGAVRIRNYTASTYGMLEHILGLSVAEGSIYAIGGTRTPVGTTASEINQTSGAISFRTDSGLTAGVAFTPTERMKIDASGNTTFTGAVATAGSNDRILFAGGGAAVGATGATTTGAIKITLPVSWTSTMVKFTVQVFDYATNESFEVHIAGYNYGTSTAWLNATAYVVGSPFIDRNFTVRFGHDGTKCVVYIGELASTWAYPQVTITEVLPGFSSSNSAWLTGWSIGYEASAFGTITATITAAQVGSKLVTPNSNTWISGECNVITAGTTVNISPAGSFFRVYNDSGSAVTLTQGSGLTMYLGGTATTGNRTLAQHGMATIWFRSTTVCVIGGNVT